MPSVLVRIDENTQRALSRVAKKGARAEFIRTAITRAIREAEEANTRRAYEAQPDADPGDDWSNCEEWKS